jgi:hypothetical protein
MYQPRPTARKLNPDTTTPYAIQKALFDWVAQRRFSTDALGKALRRLAEVGTVDQVIAFSVLVYAEARHCRRGDGVTSV